LFDVVDRETVFSVGLFFFVCLFQEKKLALFHCSNCVPDSKKFAGTHETQGRGVDVAQLKPAKPTVFSTFAIALKLPLLPR